MNFETFGSGKKLTVKDVPAIDFIRAFAAYLKKNLSKVETFCARLCGVPRARFQGAGVL